MSKIIFNLGIACLILFSSCSSDLEIEGFNSEIWKKDKKACLDNRKNELKVLLEKKEILKGESDSDILKLLGKPDEINQGSRGKKYFIYYIEPGAQCTSSPGKTGKKMVIEFDALGRARMIREEII
ncbi:MAG TPA: hypothetical protein VIK89_10700 [Cytophagaceae bacterium]